MRKYLRQAKVADLIQSNVVKNQTELSKLLAKQGINVSQVTLSRDLREMSVEKVRDVHGQFFYSLPVKNEETQVKQDCLKELFQMTCETVTVLQNIICIHLVEPHAMTLKHYFQKSKLKGVVSIMADNDEIWLLCLDNACSEQLAKYLQAVLHETDI